uniref:Uncharacterized protein n=1 Tax=Pyxicephalus adspersus TaxID=30357 RepID=A0AAV2ZYP0_PYXAD|nr:TPA: hypothetical protein GDO54_015390 [Pyxicephalus adspersus]
MSGGGETMGMGYVIIKKREEKIHFLGLYVPLLWMRWTLSRTECKGQGGRFHSKGPIFKGQNGSFYHSFFQGICLNEPDRGLRKLL